MRVLYSYLVAFNGAVSSQKLNKPPFGARAREDLVVPQPHPYGSLAAGRRQFQVRPCG
ncbi:unnamed protein product [Effrenium voratum]|nr:unnamed protein product [Effrenium voratum]